MASLTILDTIKKINPWFKTGVVPKKQLKDFQRREFSRLAKRLDDISMAELIIGGRRVGKSVLMYQLIDHLLKKSIDPKRIFFIQGDNTILHEESSDRVKILNEVLAIYQKYILDEAFDETQDAVYIFIDEAQHLPNWDRVVKTLLDLKYNLKFIITGSSSFDLRKGSQTPLTGRVKIEILPPFSFMDFSRFNNFDIGKELMEMSKKFKNHLYEGNVQGIKDIVDETSPFIKLHNLKAKFDKYLLMGGFPHIVENPKDDAGKYLKDLLTTTVAKDILSRVAIRESQAFERLMVNLCIGLGKRINYKSLAAKLGIDERSLSKYIDYYADSHWVAISSPYVFHKKAESIKTEKKVYIIDSGVVNALAFKDENDIKKDKEYRGYIIENTIHNLLLSFKQTYSGVFQNYLPFWVAPDGREIDFILEIERGVIPIESKSKAILSDGDLNPIQSFVKEKNSAKFGIITTKEDIALTGNILLIPYATLALLL